jgi:hypothetical protein
VHVIFFWDFVALHGRLVVYPYADKFSLYATICRALL